MSDIAIRAEGLSKSYQIAGQREKYSTFRDSLMKGLTAPARRARALLRGQAHGASELNETFWALQDVSFEIKHGEVIGIIGRNGAGKSTLLKILSRITEPTRGVADLYGRVGALLEVGTGFHPELTGRENLYLNGAILGMKRAEIARKFDEIVAFADIETFIDTPVKHYSSGMGLRLGFAIAAHLEPEILIVDEVLAVGDAAFQRKCIGKMSEVGSQGRTVLVVSHNMGSIETLCQRTIVLEKGRIAFDGDVREGITHYLHDAQAEQSASVDLIEHKNRAVDGPGVYRKLRLLDGNDNETLIVRLGETLVIELEADFGSQSYMDARVSLGIDDDLGRRICVFNSDDMITERIDYGHRMVIRLVWGDCRLVPGTYSIKLKCRSNHGALLDDIDRAARFEITLADVYGVGRTKMRAPQIQGVFVPSARWDIAPKQLEVGDAPSRPHNG